MREGRTVGHRARVLLTCVAAFMTISACEVPDRAGIPLPVFTAAPRTYGSYGSAEQQSYQLHTPAGWRRGEGRVLVLYAHGGGWHGGSTSDIDPLVGSLVGQGHVLLSVGYTLGVPVRRQLADLLSALRWSKGNAVALGIDPRRIILAGHSAGGHLMLMLALTERSMPIQGVLAVAAPLDLADPAYDPSVLGISVQQLIASANGCPGRRCARSALERISPLHVATRAAPPVYLVVGDRDELAPHRHAEAMSKAYATGHGRDLQVWLDVVEGGGHYPGAGANSAYVEHFIALSTATRRNTLPEGSWHRP